MGLVTRGVVVLGGFGFAPSSNALKGFVLMRTFFFNGVDLIEDEAETSGERRGFGVWV